MFGKVLLAFKRTWSHSIIRDIIIVILVYIAVNVIGGIVSNSAYSGNLPDWMKGIGGQIGEFISRNYSPVASFTVVASIISLCFLGYKVFALTKELNTTIKLTKLDNTLLRLMTNLLLDHQTKSKEDLEKQIRRLLYELLRETIQTVLGGLQKGRGAIFFPEQFPLKKDYLIVIAYHRLTPNSVTNTKFYIGKDDDKEEQRGTAGMSYLNKEMRIGHFMKKDSFECSDDSFINFDGNRTKLPYRSFVNVPLNNPSAEADTDCLGIIVLDSLTLSAFDSEKAKVLLETIAGRIGVALALYMQLLQERNYTAPCFERALFS